ncbi:MFS transporter [Halorubrum sp. JWXQ-INN 858]|uniref:twin-arginine translocase subunit TatC n=1 Tax=Halorubrum sp. JWXQ-INN 858 TaxID=2690782 RepID=UPI001356C299|nr:twin-arginine translocase subunit TatC [Halorubrum sp. JWXQ-INN 858]MWV65769.1 MFS transporter [Halorubrum sp. JWXQ-INN 858]
MDDSDRSRDEPSDPEDPAAADGADGTTPGDESGDGGEVDDGIEATDADGAGDEEEQQDPRAEAEDGAGEESDDDEVELAVAAADDDTDEDEDDDTDDDTDEDADDDTDEDEDAADDTDEDEDDDTDEDEDDDTDEDEDAADDTDEDEDDDTDEDEDDDTDEDELDTYTDDDTDGDDELGGISVPDTDEEMPLAAHIEEMMRRLAIVFLFGGLATLVAVTESTAMINYFWDYHIPAPLENRPRLYGPLELPLTRLKVAGIAGVVVGLPAFVYQTYRFMKPGLYDSERRYYLAAVPTSLVLGSVGVMFAHFLVLPAIFSYFTTYTEDAAVIAFGLAETFNLIVVMLAFMAIVFQIPLFIMLAIMMNLVTREWLEDKRLIFWGAFLGIAFLFSPDPTGMAPIIVTLTMIVLYEGTLAVLRWTGN